MGVEPAEQRTHLETPRGAIRSMGSAYDVVERNRDRDVVVNASYSGVLPARFIGAHRPRASIGVDCGIGPAGASIAGLWYLEALAVPAAAADVMTVALGDGADLYERGRVSVCNQPAADRGVEASMPVHEAARLLLEVDAEPAPAEGVTNREVVLTDASGRSVVCTDSIAFGLPEDRDRNVLCTAGHTGRTALHYIEKVHPLGFVCSDGGRGRDDSGLVGMHLADDLGIAGAVVDARRSPMGDGRATYEIGTISGCNRLATTLGVSVGMAARDAAPLLLQRQPRN